MHAIAEEATADLSTPNLRPTGWPAFAGHDIGGVNGVRPAAARPLRALIRRGSRGLEIGLDLALVLDRHRPPVAVDRLADREAHPALADAILLHIGLLRTVEADADAALEQR